MALESLSIHKLGNNKTTNFKIVNIIVIYIKARYQIGEAYLALKFFKSGANSSVAQSGPRDMDSLMGFVEKQMDGAPAKSEVRNKGYWSEFSINAN